MTKVTYRWKNDQKFDQKLPTGGQTTKVAYGSMVYCKVIPKKEGQRPKSPMEGWSNVKSSPKGKDNDQSHLWVDERPKVAYEWIVQHKVIPKREGQ